MSYFPTTKEEALTMLYLQQLDLRSSSPEHIVKLYLETKDKISSEFESINKPAIDEINATIAKFI